MVQADRRLGPKVGGHLAPCCIHHVNSRNALSMMTERENKINFELIDCPGIIIIIYYYINLSRSRARKQLL